MTQDTNPASVMTSEEAETELNFLTDEILRHDRLYYELSAPEITDAEYDILYERLLLLEAQYPEFARDDSPTQRVSGDVPVNASRVPHDYPMLSLEKTYVTAGLDTFLARVIPLPVSVGPKLDGSSLSLTYDKGKLVRGTTRGDGTYGEDVTVAVMAISSIPKTVPDTRRFEVRGEAIITKADFALLLEEGFTFKNARNAVSGSIQMDDASEVAKRRISFYGYELAGVADVTDERDAMARIEALGFQVPPVEFFESPTLEAIEAACLAIHENRDGYPYKIDGAVVKVMDFARREAMGRTGHHVKYAIAYKWQANSADTILLDLTDQTGRTGIISPVAELEPVTFEGSTVSRATLHNYDFIEKMDIRIGDRVTIIKAGEIIPKVIAVDKSARTGAERTIVPPTHCPSCGGPATHAEGDFAYRCLNPVCPARAVAALLHAVDRTRLDIDGVGSKAAEALVAAGLFKNIADIYDWTVEDLVSSGATGQKNAEKIVAAVQKSKGQPFHKVLPAFGIHTIGRSTSKTIERDFGGIDRLMAATAGELMTIPDVGPTGAEAIIAFFAREDAREMVERLRAAGVTLTAKEAPKVAAGTPTAGISGKSVAITGTLSLPRHEIQELIEAAGGRLASSISAKTDYLVAGVGGGSKRKKAAELGIPVIEEADLRTLLGD